MNISEFNDLIELIKFKKTINEKEIAAAIGRNETYISQLRNKQTIPQTAVDLLNLKFADVISNEVKAEISPEKQRAMLVGMAARQRVHGRYIAEIYAKSSGSSVTKVLSEMEQLERENEELLLKKLG